MDYLKHLEKMCLFHTVAFGDWRYRKPKQQLDLCMQLTEMYLEIRRASFSKMTSLDRDIIEGLYTEYCNLIYEGMPARQQRALMKWMHQGIQTNATTPF
jgi:hypothetical protein